MIEDGLFLALGFCIATVLSLACLPLLWGRALRLTRQRLELLVPWSKEEIDAERDGLRAQAAVTQRRLEQAAEDGRQRLAAREIELGHRTASLGRSEAAREELDAARRSLLAELGAQTRELGDSEAQRGALEKALHDADRRIETDTVAAGEQTRRYELLSSLAEERRGTIAALETRVVGLQAKVEDRDDTLDRLTATAATARAEVAKLQVDLQAARDALADLTARHDETLLARAHDRAQGEMRDARLRQRTEALAAAETRMAEQDAALKGRTGEIAALRQRFDALETELRARRADGDDAQDAALRQALTAVGDDALRLLSGTAAGGRSGAEPHDALGGDRP